MRPTLPDSGSLIPARTLSKGVVHAAVIRPGGYQGSGQYLTLRLNVKPRPTQSTQLPVNHFVAIGGICESFEKRNANRSTPWLEVSGYLAMPDVIAFRTDASGALSSKRTVFPSETTPSCFQSEFRSGVTGFALHSL
jgi:hypothetical protein